LDALASGDPSLVMSGMATRLRQATINSADSGMRSNHLGEQQHLEAQTAAYNRAAEAQKSASNWATVAKVGAYVAAGLAIVVGVAGAVYSGGTSTLGGIALACVIVSSAATIGVMAAQDLGAFGGGP